MIFQQSLVEVQSLLTEVFSADEVHYMQVAHQAVEADVEFNQQVDPIKVLQATIDEELSIRFPRPEFACDGPAYFPTKFEVPGGNFW